MSRLLAIIVTAPGLGTTLCQPSGLIACGWESRQTVIMIAMQDLTIIRKEHEHGLMHWKMIQLVSVAKEFALV